MVSAFADVENPMSHTKVTKRIMKPPIVVDFFIASLLFSLEDLVDFIRNGNSRNAENKGSKGKIRIPLKPIVWESLESVLS